VSGVRFPGLNSLRFWAAFIVFLGHAPLNQSAVGLPNMHAGAIFYRGEPAVSFFFTLSGFLITYLLLVEGDRRGKVNVPAFYLRRVLRIWPLYFLIVAFGLFFYNALLPHLGIPYEVRYSLWLAVLLYVFFLPNLMNAWYSVGGILNPTWSIGVEEQFYLAWAPAVAYWRRRLVVICIGVIAVSLALQVVARLDGVWGTWVGRFLVQLKFHFMAAGALAAMALYHRADRVLASALFSNRIVQLVFVALLLQYYLYPVISHPWSDELMQLALYPWLILEVGANPRRLARLDARWSEWLGERSYGIYLFHMIAIYATSGLFLRTTWWRESELAYLGAYYAVALGLVLSMAVLSYRLLERPILELKARAR
jgi:peptidoglycan/LPS O-acetylase OafA/YrhL